MGLDDEVNIRISRELKRQLEDKRVNISGLVRDALEKAVGKDNSLEYLMEAEESLFAQWAESFMTLYQYLQAKLKDRDQLTVSELAKLEQAWKTVENKMKSREQLMEEIPELAALTYEDCFDWAKVFKIIEKYPRTLQGRIGLVQIREGILYREVKKGNFTGLAAAREKMKAELELRAAKVKQELQAKVQSAEFQKEYLIKQEETRLEEERKKAEGTKGGFE